MAKDKTKEDLDKLISTLRDLSKHLGEAMGLPFFHLEKTPNKLFPGEEVRTRKVADIFKQVFASKMVIEVDTKDKKKGKDTKKEKIEVAGMPVILMNSIRFSDDTKEFIGRTFAKVIEIDTKDKKKGTGTKKETIKVTGMPVILMNSIRFSDDTKEFIGRTFAKVSSTQANRIIEAIKSTSSTKESSKGDKSGISKLFGNTGGLVGILAFGVGIYFIISALLKAGSINLSGAVKAIVVITAFTGLFLLLARSKEDITKSAIAFAIFGATFNFIIIPLLRKLMQIPFESVVASLLKLSLVFFVLRALINRMATTVDIKDVLKISFSFGFFSFVVSFLILPMLTRLSKLSFGTFIGAILNFILVFYVLNRMIKFVSDSVKVPDLIKISIAFGLFGFVVGFIILPTLKKLANTNLFTTILIGLIKFAAIFYSLGVTIKLFNAIVKMEDIIKMSIAFGLFGIVVGLIILPLLQKLCEIEFMTILEGIFKFGIIFLALSLLVKFASKVTNAEELIKMSLLYGLLGIVISFIIIPMLIMLSELKWGVILSGLFKFSVIMLVFAGVLFLIGKVVQSAGLSLLIGIAALFAISFVLNYLIDTLMKFAGSIPWGSIILNMALASLAIIAFGVFLVGVGAMIANPIVAFLLGVGLVAIAAISFVMGMLIDTLIKFGDANWESIGVGLLNAKGAIAAFIGIMISLPVFKLWKATLAVPPLLLLATAMNIMSSVLAKVGDTNWGDIADNMIIAKIAMFEFIRIFTSLPIMDLWIATLGVAPLLILGMAFGYLTRLLSKTTSLDTDYIIALGYAMRQFVRVTIGTFKDAILGSAWIVSGYLPLSIMLKMVRKFGNAMQEFANVIQDPNKFALIGKAVYLFGNGLRSFAAAIGSGFGAGISDAFAKFFGVDLLTKLKGFQDLDGNKLLDVGWGLKYLANGLRALAGTKFNADIIAGDINKLIKPVMAFSLALGLFSLAYERFDKIRDAKVQAEYEIKMTSENNYQQSLIELQERELSLQEEQLYQLQLNGMKLDELITKISLIGAASNSSGQPQIIPQQSKSGLTVKSQDFKTKNDYMDNMKLMTGLMQA